MLTVLPETLTPLPAATIPATFTNATPSEFTYTERLVASLTVGTIVPVATVALIRPAESAVAVLYVVSLMVTVWSATVTRPYASVVTLGITT
jgi:hypothetical protein